jgi:acyl-coenzyme A thioesterase PaaI-like protein
MSDFIDRVLDLKRSGSPEAISSLIPYMGFMGFSFAWKDGQVLGTMGYSDHLIGNPRLPALHGGATGALLESTAIFQLLWQAETVVLPKTINITVQYLRSGRPVDTVASALVTKQGRRVVAVRAEAWQEDRSRPIATADAHFLILPYQKNRTAQDDQRDRQPL